MPITYPELFVTLCQDESQDATYTMLILLNRKNFELCDEVFHYYVGMYKRWCDEGRRNYFHRLDWRRLVVKLLCSRNREALHHILQWTLTVEGTDLEYNARHDVLTCMTAYVQGGWDIRHEFAWNVLGNLIENIYEPGSAPSFNPLVKKQQSRVCHVLLRHGEN